MTYLTSLMEGSGYFEKVFPLVDQVVRSDGKMAPEQCCGKGQYTKVNDFDHVKGLCYFRETGSETVSRVDKENDVPCKILSQITYPLRMVAIVPKELLSKDDAFSDERISKTLLKILTMQGGPVQSSLKAINILFQPSVILKNHVDILAQEYSGYDKMKNLNFKYSYHAIDFNVTVDIYNDCIIPECELSY
jgi:hypothetical protein